MKKFILLFILLINFIIFSAPVFSQQNNIYATAYLLRLQNKVKQSWFLPHGQFGKSSVVNFSIDKNGEIKNILVQQSSGDNDFDNKAIEAITKAAPREQFSQNICAEQLEVQFTFSQNGLNAVLLDGENVSSTVAQIAENSSEKDVSNVVPALPKENESKKTEILNEHDGVDFEPYMKVLQRKIKLGWHPPSSFKSKRVVVLFKIKKDGDLAWVKILNSSGDDKCDNQAIRAVKKASPFSPLPSDFKGKSVDIQFTFDYNVLHKPPQFTSDDINKIRAKNGYLKTVEKIISHSIPNRIYFKPRLLIIRLKINSDGALQSAVVIHSSKDKKFDDRYLAAIKKCSFPSFPAELSGQTISMDYVAEVKRSESNNPFYWSNWFLLSMILSHAIWH